MKLIQKREQKERSMPRETDSRSGDKVQVTGFSLREEDLERLSALTNATGSSRSEAVRQCLPCASVLSVFRYLEAQNPGLTFGGCVQQVFREWLVDHAPKLSLKDLFAGLRSDDPETRIRAGKLLAMSIGIGLRTSGEKADDIEFTIGPDLSRLIGRAMAGDIGATSYLESILSNVPPPKPDVPDHAMKAKQRRVSR